MKYEIRGENLPVVICYLEEREKMITEQGAMAWMTPNMKMETNTNGIGRAFARTFSGESFFQNIYYFLQQQKEYGCKLFLTKN